MRWLPWCRLVRVGTLFSPAADVVASAAIAGLPADLTVARAAAASVCVYAAGMVWNDVADRRVDREHRPERPLVRGDISVGAAAALGVALMLLAILLSPCRLHHAVLIALVFAYDFGGKLVPWLGAIGMGTLRGLNLATGLFLASALAPDRRQALLIAASCYGTYIIAVTILGIFEDLPKVRARAVAAVQAAPPLAALCGIFAVQGSLWPAPTIAALPALWFLRRNSRTTTWDQAAIRRSMTHLLIGTMLYTALLALAAGAPLQAAGIAAAIPLARAISRRIALT